MRNHEFDLFRDELKQLCTAFGKAYTDALGKAYWRALQDVELDEVQKHVERVLLTATQTTKFPRPTELRSHAPHGLDIEREDRMTRRNRTAWDAKFKTCAPLAQWHVLCSKLAMVDAREEVGSVFHDQALQELKSEAQRLYSEYGPKWPVADPHCMHAANRLLGSSAADAAHNAHWAEEDALAVTRREQLRALGL